MRTPRNALLAGATLLLAIAAAPAAAPPPASAVPGGAKDGRPVALLGPEFPLEAAVPLPAALLHWLDSLARVEVGGATSGKTIKAHLRQREAEIGKLSDQDNEMLRRFSVVRTSFAERRVPDERGALTEAFFGAATTAEALKAARALLEPEDAATLERVVAYFEPQYRRIWNEGRVPRAFLERALADTGRLEMLETFLVELARFFGATLDAGAGPRLVLVPVPDGFGTHAQALGRFLLVEVRPDDVLALQVAPIVHETAHYLFYRTEPARLSEIESAVQGAGRQGMQAWQVLHEALPTAIAQGVADQRFRGEDWDPNQRWYHFNDVDAYAKQLFPLVKDALASGRPFGGEFVRIALTLYDPPRPRPRPKPGPGR